MDPAGRARRPSSGSRGSPWPWSGTRERRGPADRVRAGPYPPGRLLCDHPATADAPLPGRLPPLRTGSRGDGAHRPRAAHHRRGRGRTRPVHRRLRPRPAGRGAPRVAPIPRGGRPRTPGRSGSRAGSGRGGHRRPTPAAEPAPPGPDDAGRRRLRAGPAHARPAQRPPAAVPAPRGLRTPPGRLGPGLRRLSHRPGGSSNGARSRPRASRSISRRPRFRAPAGSTSGGPWRPGPPGCRPVGRSGSRAARLGLAHTARLGPDLWWDYAPGRRPPWLQRRGASACP